MFNTNFFRDLYLENHRKDKGKYKVGEIVMYVGDNFPEFKGKEFKVLASNVQDSSSTEYMLENFPYLVWEEELEKKEQ